MPAWHLLILCSHERLRDVAPLAKGRGRVVRRNHKFLYSSMDPIGGVCQDTPVQFRTRLLNKNQLGKQGFMGSSPLPGNGGVYVDFFKRLQLSTIGFLKHVVELLIEHTRSVPLDYIDVN